MVWLYFTVKVVVMWIHTLFHLISLTVWPTLSFSWIRRGPTYFQWQKNKILVKLGKTLYFGLSLKWDLMNRCMRACWITARPLEIRRAKYRNSLSEVLFESWKKFYKHIKNLNDWMLRIFKGNLSTELKLQMNLVWLKIKIVKLRRKANKINKKAIIKMCILFSNLFYYNRKLSGKCTL